MKLDDALHHRTSLAVRGLGAVDNATSITKRWLLKTEGRCGIQLSPCITACPSRTINTYLPPFGKISEDYQTLRKSTSVGVQPQKQPHAWSEGVPLPLAFLILMPQRCSVLHGIGIGDRGGCQAKGVLFCMAVKPGCFAIRRDQNLSPNQQLSEGATPETT